MAQLDARGRARVQLTLDFGVPTRATLALALFPHALTLTGLAPVLSGAGDTARAIASTGTVSLACATRSARFTVSLTTGRTSPVPEPCHARSLNLRLACRAGACDGVYPLRISVRMNGLTRTEWSLLAVRATPVVRPLSLVWISSLGPDAWAHPVRAIADLKVLSRQNLPLDIGLDYRSLGAALASTSAEANSWRSALNSALSNPLHRALSAPPDNIDFGGLAANGLSTQVALQFNLTNNLLTEATGRYVDSPIVLSGQPSLASLTALSNIGIRDVVLPETALSVAPSSTLNWGAPFGVAGTKLLALATDDPLAALAQDVGIEPGRRAAMTLALLAFLHFEAPNAPAGRTVVLDVPLASTSPTYLGQLFAGLARDPFAHLANLTPAFDSSLVGTNGAPSTRTLARAAEPAWSTRNVTALQLLIGSLNSYADAVASKSVAQSLRVAMASAEIVGAPAQRQALLDAVRAHLSTQLDQFAVDQSAVTLAGAGTALPITLLSRAPYPVTVAIHLQAPGLGFPGGSTVTATLSSPATSLRVPVTSRGASNATLVVIVTTPNNQVELAHAAIQVRVTGASVVGYLLSAASLLVLGAWWWRTVRRRRPGRHAR